MTSTAQTAINTACSSYGGSGTQSGNTYTCKAGANVLPVATCQHPKQMSLQPLNQSMNIMSLQVQGYCPSQPFGIPKGNLTTLVQSGYYTSLAGGSGLSCTVTNGDINTNYSATCNWYDGAPEIILTPVTMPVCTTNVPSTSAPHIGTVSCPAGSDTSTAQTAINTACSSYGGSGTQSGNTYTCALGANCTASVPSTSAPHIGTVSCPTGSVTSTAQTAINTACSSYGGSGTQSGNTYTCTLGANVLPVATCQIPKQISFQSGAGTLSGNTYTNSGTGISSLVLQGYCPSSPYGIPTGSLTTLVQSGHYSTEASVANRLSCTVTNGDINTNYSATCNWAYTGCPSPTVTKGPVALNSTITTLQLAATCNGMLNTKQAAAYQAAMVGWVAAGQYGTLGNPGASSSGLSCTVIRTSMGYTATCNWYTH